MEVRECGDDGELELKNHLEKSKSGKCLENLFSSAKEISISEMLI